MEFTWTHLIDPLSALPGYVLRRAAHAMMTELAARLSAIDLRISNASVLLLIAERTDLTSSEIGKVLDIQRANIVPLLNRLSAATLAAIAGISPAFIAGADEATSPVIGLMRSSFMLALPGIWLFVVVI